MPRIRDLRRFVKRYLKSNHDWVDFKVIHADAYRKRDWFWSREARISVHNGKYEVTVWFKSEVEEEKEFDSLDEAVNYVLEKYPSEIYVYYKPVFRFYNDFTNVRNLFGFTIDEAYAWKTVLARAMGHLNGRELLGFRKLRETSKKCDRCRKGKAVLLVVFDYHGRRYGVYYCRECWKKRVYSLWANLVKEVGRIKDKMLELVEPPMTHEEVKELEEYLAIVDEDIHYMKELGMV